MRFIIDECIGNKVTTWLKNSGHDVISIYDDYRGEKDCIILTNDKDFEELVYRDNCTHKGIILLRLEDESSSIKMKVLNHILKKYSDKLKNNFIVATEKGYLKINF